MGLLDRNYDKKDQEAALKEAREKLEKLNFFNKSNESESLKKNSIPKAEETGINSEKCKNINWKAAEKMSGSTIPFKPKKKAI